MIRGENMVLHLTSDLKKVTSFCFRFVSGFQLGFLKSQTFTCFSRTHYEVTEPKTRDCKLDSVGK